MCGIAGIISKNNIIVEEKALRKMTDQLAHRGPDAEGFFLKDKFGFGHRRLSIFDLSSAADQPFHYKDNVLIFNGAIYNYVEIKAELEKADYLFTTTSDTEVLLAAYDFWGEKCVEKFNGMWSFAIFDPKKNIIFCSRDRFGVKPFYYFSDQEQFIFASEIKPVLEVKKIQEVNVQVLIQFIAVNLTEQTDETFFQGINKLQGSHNLVYSLDTNTFRIYRYYDIEFNKEIADLNLKEAITLFEKEFTRSINLRLRSDVKIGSALSGGLDSSYLAMMAAQNLADKDHSKLNVVSMGSKSSYNDETYYSDLVCDHLHLKKNSTYPDKEEFEKSIEDVIRTQEEPFEGLSIYMQNFLMRYAKESGIKVLLDGQGADEILLGYSGHISPYVRNNSFWHGVQFFYNIKSHYGISVVRGLVKYFHYNIFLFRKLRINFRARKLKDKYRKAIDFTMLKKLTKSYSRIFEMQKMDIFHTQLPELLRFEDKNAMSYAVETRLPYLDYKFVETCLSLNNKFKINKGWSKYILRKSMDGKLPEEICWRSRKIGFEAPSDDWWPYDAKILQTINNSGIIQELYSKKFNMISDRELQWKLYNIALWENIFEMKISTKKN